jgi:hypothetical protein
MAQVNLDNAATGNAATDGAPQPVAADTPASASHSHDTPRPEAAPADPVPANPVPVPANPVPANPFAPPGSPASWGPPPTVTRRDVEPRQMVGPLVVPRSADELRHPLDPDVRTSTGAAAVLLLGVSAVLMMFCMGGVVPGVLGLALARRARVELLAARGFLGGDGMLRMGVAMCRVAVVVSLLIVFVTLVVLLIRFGTGQPPTFGGNVD